MSHAPYIARVPRACARARDERNLTPPLRAHPFWLKFGSWGRCITSLEEKSAAESLVPAGVEIGVPDSDEQLMQQSRSSGSGGSMWCYGRKRTGTWIWNSGWDETAWSSNGWQEGWQDDGAEEDSPTKDSRQPHDPDAPQREPWDNCADGQDANSGGAEDQLLVPEDSATEPTNGGLAAEGPVTEPTNEKDVLRRLHEKALRCFHRDVPELGSDDEVPAGAQKTQMLVDHHDIDAGIAEFHPATGGVTCNLCNKALNSKSQWADHQKGKKHFKKLSAEERKRANDVQKLDRTKVPAASFL